MNLNHALFGGHTEAQRKAIVARTAMHVEAIASATPEPVIGHFCDGAHDGPRQTEADQADLPAVRVTRQNQIGVTFRQMSAFFISSTNDRSVSQPLYRRRRNG